ncbi:MAG: hypothetical protein MHM6MM_004406 [Cercozoa sp. M6MM]
MSIELYSPQYFATCAVGGVLSCGLSHTLLTPVDLAKCNAQANPQVYNKGMAGNLKLLMQQQGTIGAVRGWLPTLLGYSLQGANKFGWYEVFKHYYGKAVGDEFFSKYQSLVFMAASASAEFLADIMYVPFESIKVRVQTDMKMPASMVKSAGIMHKEEGMNAFFKSLSPLWARQIPYTIIKFVAFEKIVRAIYGLLPGDAADYNKTQKLGVTLAAGYSAGVICGAVSHPADTMVSKLSAGKTEGSTMDNVKRIYGEIGFNGLWKGFGPRVFMIGTLTAVQWFIYDAYKVASGLPTTGSKK